LTDNKWRSVNDEGVSVMEISARNQLKGTVKNIVTGGVMAEVTIDIGNGQEIVSVITKTSAERLGLAPGVEVTAVIKSSEVMLAR
jgi:molybdopterin-binding protein